MTQTFGSSGAGCSQRNGAWLTFRGWRRLSTLARQHDAVPPGAGTGHITHTWCSATIGD